MRDYVGFLEGDPVAKYARMMGNYIATNVDEQLLAAYLYLGANGGTTIDGTDPLEQAFRIAHYSSCLLYTSPSPRDRQKSRMPSSA